MPHQKLASQAMKATRAILFFACYHALTAAPQEKLHTQTGLFKFIRTEAVTPDSKFLIGGFVRVGYVPATDRLVAVFGTKFAQPFEGSEKGHACKEYNLDMQATGKSGALNGNVGDSGGLFVDNTYYDVSVHREGESSGWRIIKYDAVTWGKLADIFFPLDAPREAGDDMMVAFVNGRLDISSGYTTYGGPSPPDIGASTHHQFFSTDLNFLEKKILSDTPHIGGSSLIYVDGVYHFITATAYTGNVIVMKYDKDWKYLGMKELRKQAHWSTGVAFDGQRFYVAYLNTSQRTEPVFFPYYPNVRLAAFDRDWNLVDDVAVTNYAPSDSQFTGRPWVLFHANRLYVSYDDVPLPGDLDKIEGFVSIYELSTGPSSIEQPEALPMGFQLEQNYPNPFNPATSIAYSLPHSGRIRIAIFDLQGRCVKSLMDGMQPAGRFKVCWNGTDAQGSPLPAGLYCCRMETAGLVRAIKLSLVK